MKYLYNTEGVCPRVIEFEIDENGKVHNVIFLGGGCPGNLQAVPKLVEGLDAKEVIEKLKGINCAGKGTSCADQLARAIEINIK